MLSLLFFSDSPEQKVMYLHVIVHLINSMDVLKPLPGLTHTLKGTADSKFGKSELGAWSDRGRIVAISHKNVRVTRK